MDAGFRGKDADVVTEEDLSRWKKWTILDPWDSGLSTNGYLPAHGSRPTLDLNSSQNRR